MKDWVVNSEVDKDIKEIASYMCEEDMGYVMPCGDTLCLDGLYNREELLKMAVKIQEVFKVE